MHPDMCASSPRQRFAALASYPDRELDLAEGALLISAEENPGLDPKPSLELLEDWAEELRPRVARRSGDLDRLSELCGFLYREKGLAGNRKNYYDPRNSFLDQVLERRLGIPITLAVVLLEVGRRVGVPLVGIGFPGHFLVRHACHPQLLVDPFDSGNVLTREDCSGLLERLTHGRIPFSPRLLHPVGPRQVLQRILNNLCGVYLAAGELGQAISALDRVLLLAPGEPRVLRGRGILRLKAGDCPGAVHDLEAYLEAEPDASDWNDVAAVVEEARQVILGVH